MDYSTWQGSELDYGLKPPAADVLKDVNDLAPAAYEDIYKAAASTL